MRFIYVIICLFITSCASTVNEVSDGSQVLPENMGYVLIPVISNTNIHQIRFLGQTFFQLDKNNLTSKRNFILIELPAGQYSYSKLFLNQLVVLDDFEDGVWDFTVKAGVINYVGDFVVHNNSRIWGKYQLSVSIENNSSVALEYLEKQYPTILQSYELTYNGPGEDDFFPFIKSLTTQMGEQ